jgi:hypothetical protein
MREELVLHGWDITGDDAAAQARMAQPWMTTHSVLAVGMPLLAKGAKQLRSGERIEALLRVADADDVVVDADANRTTIRLADPDRPPWKPTPQRVSCCCGAAGPPTHRGSAAVSVRKPWAE